MRRCDSSTTWASICFTSESWRAVSWVSFSIFWNDSSISCVRPLRIFLRTGRTNLQMTTKRTAKPSSWTMNACAGPADAIAEITLAPLRHEFLDESSVRGRVELRLHHLLRHAERQPGDLRAELGHALPLLALDPGHCLLDGRFGVRLGLRDGGGRRGEGLLQEGLAP